jgi:hypothetical protein
MLVMAAGVVMIAPRCMYGYAQPLKHDE